VRLKGLALCGLILVAMALVAAAAVPALRAFGGASAGDVPVYRVERGDFVNRVHADGNLKAVDATLLGPPPEVTDALKIAWLAPDGSHVEEGEVVVRFDPSELEEELRSGEYERNTAESKIVQKEALERASRTNLERDAEIASLELDYAKKFQSKDARIFSRVQIIESEIDEELAGKKQAHAAEAGQVHEELVESELDLLTIERRQAEIRIDHAETGLQALEVRAPHAGIFVLKQWWGRMPEVGQTVWGGNAIAEIPKLDAMEAEVFVLEADAGGLEAGLPATVVIEAHPDEEYRATVKSVDALAQRRNRRVPVQYFRVTLELQATDPTVMKPGQRVRSVVALAELEDVVSVPRQAVFEEESKKIVYRRQDGGFKPIPVELGPSALGRVVIERGVSPGDTIALRDPTRPADAPAESSGDAPSGPMGTGS
jgi:HlyD family secretion protein